MSADGIYVFGGGGFGRELAQLINDAGDATNARLLGFIDDDPESSDAASRFAPVHSGANLAEFAGQAFLVGIGNPNRRESVVTRLHAAALVSSEPIIHPRAWVGQFVELGAGSVICAGSSVTTNIAIGAHVHVNLNCTIGHDAVIEDFVTMSPGTLISGNVRLERGCELGTGAIVLPGLVVGAGAIVGAGAVVSRNVEPGTTVVGIPARAASTS